MANLGVVHHERGAAGGRTAWAVGGDISCATWMQDESSGRLWIWGYWTGRNIEALKSVGSSTDSNGLVAEIRLICKAEPSLCTPERHHQALQAV